MRVLSLFLSGLLLLTSVEAGAQTVPVEGLRENPASVHALTNARIVVSPGRVVERGTVVIRDGLIEAVGANVRVPADARVWELGGRTLYPGFIDAYTDVGMPTEVEEAEAERGAVYWNPQVRSFVDAASVFGSGGAGVAELRAQGFTVGLAVPRLGMFRGQAAAVSLGEGPVSERVLRPGVAQAVSLARDGRVGTGYPTSAMGAIAFIRQTLYDADWHARARAAYERDPRGTRRPELNRALDALGPVVAGSQPLLFEVRSAEEFLRARRIAEEFGISPWIRASGSEYLLLDAIGKPNVPLIVPVAFPAAPDVKRPEAALSVSLSRLRHWHLAPENPARLAAAGIEFALTADGLERRSDFLPNVRRAVARGLPADVALAALTTVPARYLGLERTHGTLEPGKVANIVVVEGDLFDDGAEIRDVWVDGRRYEITAAPGVEPRGRWIVATAQGPALSGELVLEGTPNRLAGTFSMNGQSVRLSWARVADAARRLHVAFPADAFGMNGVVRLTGSIAGSEIHGWGELPDGTRVNWNGRRDGAFVAEKGAGSGATGSKVATLELPELRPSMEYGRDRVPEQPAHVLVRNATVWTMGPQGVLENADVLIRRGEVVEVGRGLSAPRDALVIDATGKHVTPGLIDPHLHSGISGGVNETGSAIVPEVRIGDVLTIDNIWMYRQLAGGLTTAHLKHGSANPIGGQNQVIKLRWGALPEELKLDGAPRTVKFALGENPKRRQGRYPDTRMGTEQIIRDHFQSALEYRQRWQEWERNGRRGVPPRRDLRLEALDDILSGRIEVQSHSYRQDEILMLMRLAEDFGFRIKAFHHGVEAYKVAPELAKHGAGAVVWSDWSSFKIEAYDATTYNARILHDAGVVTSLHSDDSQIASRMNWEAAKMLRTGMSEWDALALVTINPAKILGIDARVGSLEPGKDADFVIWSGHPLSTATRAEQTWIDGRKYFDLEEDRALRDRVERERARLIQSILEQR